MRDDRPDRRPSTLLDYGVKRVARERWRCVAADPERRNGTPNPDYRPGCIGNIMPGDVYYEYMGEAAPYASGTRYCLPCAEAVWG